MAAMLLRQRRTRPQRTFLREQPGAPCNATVPSKLSDHFSLGVKRFHSDTPPLTA